MNKWLIVGLVVIAVLVLVFLGSKQTSVDLDQLEARRNFQMQKAEKLNI